MVDESSRHRKFTFWDRHGEVLIYVPNLIGYARVCCSLCAFHAASRNPLRCLCLYLASFVCDELDGRAARYLNQASAFGAVLDMVTDRISTMGLLVLLCLQFPQWYMAFISLMSLDIFSHWLQMYSTLLAGDISHKQHHNQSWLVRIYYTHRTFMGACCISCEVLYLALYLLSLQGSRDTPLLPSQARQPYTATIAGHHVAPGVPLVLVVVGSAVPGFLVKQIINVAQLRAAARTLVIYDQRKDIQQEAKTA